MGVRVRPAMVGDEHGIAAVHVGAWQAAYRGLMPDAYLDSLEVDERARMWGEGLARGPRPGVARLVAVADGSGTGEVTAGALLGFLVAGPEVGAADATRGEVYSLNVLPSAWAGGVGTHLLAAGVAALAEHGWAAAVLWVHPANARARRFYERCGWAADGAEQVADVLGVTVPEVRYTRPLP